MKYTIRTELLPKQVPKLQFNELVRDLKWISSTNFGIYIKRRLKLEI